MRIVIDLQGAQTASRFRGIGRYSLALALAIARNAREHEVWLLLNASLADSIPDIRSAFEGLVPAERIRVFDIPGHTAERDSGNLWRTRAAEKIREHVIEDLQPDAVLVTSLFEGYVDDGVVSVGTHARGDHTAVILYDLIPLLNPTYLPTQPQRQYYDRKIDSLRNAGLLLSISDYSRQEGLDALGVAPERIVSISTAVDESFVPSRLSAAESLALHQRFGITRKMVMYAPGGFDTRKNIDGLITAYSLLPAALRATHQLVVASKLGDVERTQLDQVRVRTGLAEDELVLTGYVPDEDLRALYSSATLFVFPSKHEGFGLPALEAMACGAPVIASNTTSLPEVIGLEEAMFDPLSPQAIADKMQQVLEDENLRERLLDHGRTQSKKFSWDASARRALRALEAHHANQSLHTAPIETLASVRPRLAFVSPLPPERTGIATYSAELLPSLMAHFEIELVSDQSEFDLPPELSGLPRRSVAWFAENGQTYDRIVYQMGNSPFHTHMFSLVHRHPGTVVLHDFFLSGVLAFEEITGRIPGVWSDALYHAHGYFALKTRFEDMEAAKQKYPCNLDLLQSARGLIVHSEFSRVLGKKWYGQGAGDDWTVIPLLRTAAPAFDRKAARKKLGIREDAFVVCSVGFVDPTKLTHRLLDAWLASALRHDARCELVLAGDNNGGEYGAKILARIRECGMEKRIRITGWTDDEVYNLYLQAADASVQLRTMSRGETSAAVLHCLKYGLPTIVNANGTMAELADDAVWKLPDEFHDAELVTALETLWSDETKRSELSVAAQNLITTRHDPVRCAQQYADVINSAHASSHTDLRALLRSLADIPDIPTDEQQAQLLAQTVARCTADRPRQRQLLVDVSAIARNDLQTGIERVVRAQLVELLRNPPAGFRVEPVYLSSDGGAWHYSYAREYTQKLLDIPHPVLRDAPADVFTQDVFYGADFYPGGVIEAARAGIYADWRARGVEVNFLIFDILPILRPEFFPEGADKNHAEWINTIANHADRLLCISNAVVDEVHDWLHENRHVRASQLKLAATHLGADINASVPSTGMPEEAQEVLQRIASVPTFLMVGTIEPRKGHLQTIAAFEQLWRDGVDVNLVIVGKEGWKPVPTHLRRTIPQIVDKLNHHPELGKRLFWLQGISDEYLQHLYAASACLVFASEGEGFGLPLIEAAQVHLPIIARGLPVFREVAQEHAFYFDGLDAGDLANAIRDWLRLRAEGSAPSSEGMPWLTWAQSAVELAAALAGERDRQATNAYGCVSVQKIGKAA